ncbi:MAG: 50S ribosomal protein L32 [Actinomycetia bacterium]|nr:50S ribosomal protein L32 [Actinomycetes bacterium]
MAVPKRKSSKCRTRSRKANWKSTTPTTLNECPQCHEPKRPHHVCTSCGTYNGREVLEVK